MDHLKEFVGLFVLVINFVSAFSIFSQVRLTYRRKNSVGLSRLNWMMGASNAFIGIFYSILIGDVVFAIANFAWFAANGTMVLLLLRYRNPAVPGTPAT